MSEPGRRNPEEGVTYGVRVAAAWTWRVLLIGLGVYVLTQIFFRIELVAFSFVIALFLTAILHPLERTLRKLPGTRSLSAALALLIGLAVLGGIAYFVSWQISQHSAQLGDQISQFVDQTRDWLRNGPLHLKSTDLDNAVNEIKKAVKSHQDQLISGAIATVRTVIEALGALLLILLSTFFLLRDGSQIWAWVVSLFPRAARERVDRAGEVGWHTLGGYMRGQVAIALFHGISVTIVLLILQIPLAPALGVLIFLGSFIPLIGLTVTGALCTVVALLEHGPGAAIAVAVAIVVLVQLEAHLLQPLIMSRSVKVHPLAIALAVLTGTLLSGIVGALLAVPLVAFINSTVHALRDEPALPSGDAGFPVGSKESVGGDHVDMASLPGDEDRDSNDDTDSDEDGDEMSASDDSSEQAAREDR